jgi:predicted O-methyltransferase YrrM
MVYYDLTHLGQPYFQSFFGKNNSTSSMHTIQDDEALFLYAIIRGSMLKNILEVGGLKGYSAQNFLAAIEPMNDGFVYTVDINPVKSRGVNHKTIQKNVAQLTSFDVDGKIMDMVFFDCNDMVQMDMYHNLVKEGIITDDTILALHDTNLHYINSTEGTVHQPVEREMVNIFKSLGYDCFCLHTDASKHGVRFPFRHGITVCKKFKPLTV